MKKTLLLALLLGPTLLTSTARADDAPSAPPPTVAGAGTVVLPPWIESVPYSRPSLPGFAVTGYVQGEIRHDSSSEDEISQTGQPLNRDQFLVRRGRIRASRTTEYTSVAVEVDGNTTRGPLFGIRRAEATVLLRGNPPEGWQNSRAVPLVAATIGLTEIPFGYELVDSPRTRVFLERTTGSLALFPGEPDVGARLAGGYSVFRYAVSYLNGNPVDDRPGRSPIEFDSSKDLVARLGFDVPSGDWLRVTGGTSFLRGKGFHPGTPATKPTINYRDLDENGRIDSGETTALPGSAAVPSKTYDHWAVGADLQVRFRTPIGWSLLYAEAFASTNLDRGIIPADPVLTGIDKRELGYYVAAVQDVFGRGIVGFRFDVYDPNADFLDKRQGKLVPASQAITTTTALLGVQIDPRARLFFQLDHVNDFLARDARGVPVDLSNDRAALRLQVEM